MHRRLPRLKYPKLTLLVLTYIIAYMLFSAGTLLYFNEIFISLGYLGIFLAGMFFSYGFTAGPATAILLLLAKKESIFLAAAIGGVGSLVADLVVFSCIRHSVMDEIHELKSEKIFSHVSKHIPGIIKRNMHIITPLVAGFIIASPLPDEIGVALFASSTKVSARTFSIVSFLLNTTGIFMVLVVGHLI